jgi:hypothetical protein
MTEKTEMKRPVSGRKVDWTKTVAFLEATSNSGFYGSTEIKWEGGQPVYVSAVKEGTKLT